MLNNKLTHETGGGTKAPPGIIEWERICVADHPTRKPVALLFSALCMLAATQPRTALATAADFKNTDFAAAAPFTYNHETGGGAYNDGTVGEFNDTTEQLQGAQFSCGDTVTYFANIEMEAATDEINQSARLSFNFLANSTGQAGAAHSEVTGVSINYGSVENGDDGTGTNPGAGFFGLDSGINDDGNSTVSIISTGLTGPLFQSGSELELTVEVSDLEAGESVVLRIDTQLACQSGSSPTGNLQGQLDDVTALPSNEAAGSGAQTIPFLKVGDIAGAGEPLLSITKTVTTSDGACGTDDVEELAATDGDTVKYCYVIENFGTADLFDVEVIDDNATPGDPTDDFTLVNGVNLAGGATITLEASVAIDLEGSNPMSLVNTVTATGADSDKQNSNILTESDTATVNASPIPNRPPVANDDAEMVLQGESVNIDAAGNDSDPDGNLDPTTTTVTTSPSNGALVNNGDGTFSYTPDPTFSGVDTFTYQICDIDGLCDTAEVTITVSEVQPVNSPPDAVTDTVSTDEETLVTINATLNDTDIDGNLVLSTANTNCTICTTPQHGSLVNNGDGTFNYTPVAGYNGPDSFIYEICDADGLCDTATVNITVNGVNDPPVAEDDLATTDEDTLVNIPVVSNDEDIDGNLDYGSIVVLNGGPSNGTAEVQEDGSIDYTPNPDFYGEDTFTYQICDTDGLCDSATVTVTVNPVNDAPVASDDNYTTPEDTELTVDIPGILSNDSDVDGDGLTVNVLSQPSNGTLTQNPDGSFSYTPNENYNGTDSYTYQACDPSGACSEVATVTINVTPVNDNPDAVDDNANVSEDEAVDIQILSNDNDADDDELTVTNVSDPAHGTTSINPDGTIHYEPDTDYCGQDTFTYTISDGNGGSDTATVTINVICVNDPPLANNDTAATDEDTAIVVNVQDNDNAGPAGEDQTLTTTEVTDPPNGTAAINPDGTVTYIPDADFNGEDTFSYTVCDSDGLCDTATVKVVIGGVNDAPVAVDDVYNTDEDTILTVPAPGTLDNDSDVDGDTLTVTKLTDPANGTLTQNPDGSLTYAPNLNFNGVDSYTYEACDPSGLCDSATVTITVNSVNDAPVATDDVFTTPEDTLLTVNVPGILGNDSDVDGDLLTATVLTQPANGTLSQNADGSFTYQPNPDFNGGDSYTYKACDPDGSCDEATVTINVDPVNDTPVAVDDAYSTDEDTELTVPAPGILGNDSDVDGDALTVHLLTDPSNGTLEQNADGSFTYTPNENFNGLDSYTYEACDPSGQCDTATVIITVNPVNDDPVANDDFYITAQNTTLNVNDPELGLLPNDSDPADGDEVNVESADNSSAYGGSVTVNSDGTLSYTPPTDFAGFDTVTYTISDGYGGTDSATVTIEVTAKNGRSISVSWGDWTLLDPLLSGAFNIVNQSGSYDVQLQSFEVIVQYRDNGPGKKEWINVAVEGCSYDPSTPTILVDELWVSFESCELQDAIPAGSTVRVTAVTGIYGHKDKGKNKQTFLSRLSKAL